MKLRTCVSPEGKFIYGIHKPRFTVANMRENDFLGVLGLDTADRPVRNFQNFPEGDVMEPEGVWIYEIPNPFPFRGATYIDRNWAEAKAADPLMIELSRPVSTSMSSFLSKVMRCGEGGPKDIIDETFAELPENVMLTLVMNY